MKKLRRCAAPIRSRPREQARGGRENRALIDLSLFLRLADQPADDQPLSPHLSTEQTRPTRKPLRPKHKRYAGSPTRPSVMPARLEIVRQRTIRRWQDHKARASPGPEACRCHRLSTPPVGLAKGRLTGQRSQSARSPRSGRGARWLTTDRNPGSLQSPTGREAAKFTCVHSLAG
jgi:hypothetical protein